MTSNNAEWERGWSYLRNDGPGLPPYTGKILKEKADSWWHDVSPSSRQDRLESALQALKDLADAGLGAASVLANLHHRRIIPLMERRLRIFEMGETADPVALAQSRLLPDLLPQEYAATRARRAINLKAIRHGDSDLWSFVMLPEGPLVSRASVFSPAILLATRRRGLTFLLFPAARDRERRTVQPAHASSLSARAAQRREQERAALKEKRIRWRERREQRSEEFRLREKQGLSSPATSEYSSSDEEKVSDGERALPERWEPAPPSPRAAEAAEETAPGAGAGVPAARQPTREVTRTAEGLARAMEATGGAATATSAAAATATEPPRKRKRGFSTLR
jgi:hypothetical protein